MGYWVRICSMENFFPHIDFEYVFLDLTKNSKSGSDMVSTASLAPIWSAPLANSPHASPTFARFVLSLIRRYFNVTMIASSKERF